MDIRSILNKLNKIIMLQISLLVTKSDYSGLILPQTIDSIQYFCPQSTKLCVVENVNSCRESYWCSSIQDYFVQSYRTTNSATIQISDTRNPEVSFTFKNVPPSGSPGGMKEVTGNL